jgi:hypothetical protein
VGSGGGGHGQWLSGRAVAATNGGASGDVGAVEEDDIVVMASAEEGRAGKREGSSGRCPARTFLSCRS